MLRKGNAFELRPMLRSYCCPDVRSYIWQL